MSCPCPRRSRIICKSDQLSCGSSDCPNYSGFPVLGEKPILIPFDQQTIFSPEDFATGNHELGMPQRSRSEIGRVLRDLLSVRVGNTAKNIDPVLAELKPGARALIVGGGTIGIGMDGLIERGDLICHAFDVYASPNIELIADAHFMPYSDDVFDFVVIQAVLEHVLQPDLVVSEIFRVLKQGGMVYSEVPFLQAVHEGPYDFTRFTLSGHVWLFRAFAIEASGPHGGPAVSLAWAIKYLAWAVLGKRVGQAVFALTFPPLALLDRLLPGRRQADAASGSWLRARKAQQPTLDAKSVPKLYCGLQR